MDYPERQGLRIILDYVERYNKKDESFDVAHAAQDLEKFLEEENKKAEVDY